MSNVFEYNLPSNEQEWYAKGTFTDTTGDLVRYEIPAVFEDGVCDNDATLEKINMFIDRHNIQFARED